MKLINILTLIAFMFMLGFFKSVWDSEETVGQPQLIDKSEIIEKHTEIAPTTYTGEIDPPKTQPWQISHKGYNPNDSNLNMPEKKTEELPAKLLPIPKVVDNPNKNVFIKGEAISCIYDAVFSWDNGDEFIKPISMNCIVIDASEVWADEDFGPYYQHVQVDCSADIKKRTGKPGVGMVKNHKLNYKQRWYTSRDCYHFTTED